MATSTILLFLSLLCLSFGNFLALDFIFNGFQGESSLSLSGASFITDDGALKLSNPDIDMIGNAFYYPPISMFNNQTRTPIAASFSTMFIFLIKNPNPENEGGQSLAFTVSPSNLSNPVFSIEFGMPQVVRLFLDIKDNPLAIDVNRPFDLECEKPIQVWVEYKGEEKILGVALSPISLPKPNRPLFSCHVDLSLVLEKLMYIGFSSLTSELFSYHYILGWSFSQNEEAQPPKFSLPPSPPQVETESLTSIPKGLKIEFAFSVVAFLVIVIATSIYLCLERMAKCVKALAELQENPEDWEKCLPHRIPFKDLYVATNGFDNNMIIRSESLENCDNHVYKGVLPAMDKAVAIKKIRLKSEGGVEEIMSEFTSLTSIGHTNLAPPRGWCKKDGFVYLVSDFFPRGNLEGHIHNKRRTHTVLNWAKRFKILKEVALAILYLHEDWKQVIVHNLVKASNVYLDSELNARLGDLGHNKVYMEWEDIERARVVTRIMPPEVIMLGKVTCSSDVYSYGLLLLEVASGKRGNPFELIKWVTSCRRRGYVLKCADPKLKYYAPKEMELVLKLGLCCLEFDPALRPSMRQVVESLNGGKILV